MLKKVNEWNEANVKHLLSRTMFGYKREDVEFALSLSLDDFVDNYLLGSQPTPPPPGAWVTEMPDWDHPHENFLKYVEFAIWSYELMRTQPTSFSEKMVHFLSNHFVTEGLKIKIPQYQYIQNALFREYAFGNFKELTKKVTIDPAMLVYLDGILNNKNVPNENYAREVMELFTLGIGNYSEMDVRNAAKAFSGWELNGLTATLNNDLFDDGTKTFLGKTGNFNYSDIIDIIFEQEAAAEFICRKLYKEFIYYIPNETIVNEFANIFRNNNYELKPLFSAMFKSEHFYNEKIKAAKIKSPHNLMIGMFKQFNVENINYNYVIKMSDKLQQRLFSEPDVRGWQGQRKWISTTTLPLRNNFTESILTGVNPLEEENPLIGFKVNVLEFARTFNSSENAEQFVSDIVNFMLLYPISQNTKDRLLQVLLDGSAKEDWSTYNRGAETKLTKFFKALTNLPEYQLS